MNLIEVTHIEDIYEMWNIDSKIDTLTLDEESLKTPALHSKYIRLLGDERRQLNRMLYTHKVLEKDKSEYYRGTMCEEDMEARGWEPKDIRVLKTDVPKYVDGDEDVVKHLIQISDQREKVELLISILKTIHSRNWDIRNAIEWRKFLGGAN